ncbi:MAG: hypothetical protein BWY82_00272 [Verrucomicrobia bacterium ADurb.Bin474]|nr:MAG: hypothetical protein BWY82_00272 [Verrucomicrobia bacterium ADurb.Bin474]
MRRKRMPQRMCAHRLRNPRTPRSLLEGSLVVVPHYMMTSHNALSGIQRKLPAWPHPLPLPQDTRVGIPARNLRRQISARNPLLPIPKVQLLQSHKVRSDVRNQ